MKNKLEMENQKYSFLLYRSLRRTTIPLFLFLFTLFLLPGQLTLASSLIDKNVSIQMKNVSLSKVLDTIEKQSGYSFLVRNNDVNLNDVVSINVKNESVEEILNTLFTSKGLTYEIKGKRITIYRPRKIEQKVVNTKSKETIAGTVKDSKGESIIGANVLVVGTSSGTITDIDGNFTLKNVPGKSVIKVSCVGYVTQETEINGKNSLDIVLEENAKKLDEVVVVGYGVQKKENLTGSVTSIKMDEVLGDRPVANATTALQGAIPGLQITRSSTPGQDKNSINIRGTVSINGGDPLVLIDNVPGDLSMVNPEDIESVTVLKGCRFFCYNMERVSRMVLFWFTKLKRQNQTTCIFPEL